MALRTIGTNSSTSLNGFVVGFNDTIAADLATLNNALKSDPPGWNAWQVAQTSGLVSTGVGSHQAQLNQCYVKQGFLIIPNRGHLQLIPGDFVAYDTTTGWPIVISGYTAANGPYTHT